MKFIKVAVLMICAFWLGITMILDGQISAWSTRVIVGYFIICGIDYFFSLIEKIIDHKINLIK